MKHTTFMARLAIGLCGCTVGSYCALSAFRNGQNLAPGIDGMMFGAAFAAVVIGSWFILPLSRSPLARAGWLLCTGFVLANAIGFTATHRTGTVGEKQNSIATYNTALTGLQQATERLTAMKGNRRWESTSGCTNATVEQSVTFCNQFSATQAKADKFQAIVSAGKPATADAQADTIGWVIRADTATVSKALPIFMAVTLDVAATLFMFLALASNLQKMQIAEPVATPKAEPAKAKKRTTRKSRAVAKKHDAKLKAAKTVDEVFGAYRKGTIDGRTKIGRTIKQASNTNVGKPANVDA